MINIYTKSNTIESERTLREMFQTRAQVFGSKLGWDLHIEDGLEKDRYDSDCDPVYIVSEGSDGKVLGSLRLLPTDGPTMLQNEFREFFDIVNDFASDQVWECTRFCVPAQTSNNDGIIVSRELLAALCNFSLRCGIKSIIGVYYSKMMRVYNRIGWLPTTVAYSLPAYGSLELGRWDVTEEVLRELQAGLPSQTRLPMKSPRQAAA